MIFDILFIILGVWCVLKGADYLTEGAAAVARRMHIPEMIIGLTIVAAGTSAPELFVSVVSALKGTSDMAVGNVVGSNIMNTMLIVGVAAMVAPMNISKNTVKKDLPFTVAASMLLLFLAFDHFLGHVGGFMLLAGFALFMAYSIYSASRSPEPDSNDQVAQMSKLKSAIFVLGGLLLLIVGSNVFVDHASQLALSMGISEGVVGLTVVAGGTSLPELATTVVAARKGQSALAIGNVIGSNVFNILLILGLTATIHPLQIEGITTIDMAVMLLSVSFVWIFCFTRLKVERWEGATLLVGYLAYLIWLIVSL
ncbi:MAG: calcium/sodium antiporter [Prevotella sp.]|nr:calcium/sodium antiporter [Prevotella sp.]